MANSAHPDQMPHLVCVYIVGKGLSVSILRVIMVMFHTPQPVTQNDCTDQYHMGHVKQNGAFEYSQNAQIEIQLTLVISTSLISNNRLSRSENLVPAYTRKPKNRWKIL